MNKFIHPKYRKRLTFDQKCLVYDREKEMMNDPDVKELYKFAKEEQSKKMTSKRRKYIMDAILRGQQ